MLKETLLREAKEIEEDIVSHRRYLHANPGTGFAIEETLAYVEKELLQMGYEVKRCGTAGLTALAGGKRQGKVFLLRADMDALPIKEESGVEFAAQNGKMHACGHDMHTAMLLGAAQLLRRHSEEMEGTIKLMFQPAEEIFEGSRDMIEAGLLENPSVDAALMIHVMAGLPLPAGTLVVSSPGITAPAADYFEIRVKGKGCHGSMPNTGVDPLTAAAHIIIALQELHARELAMGDEAALTIGTLHGGAAANVIPDEVVMEGSIRTFDEETRAFLKKRMTEIAEGIAHSFRAEAKVEYKSGCPVLVNDEKLSKESFRYAVELLGKERAFLSEELKRLSGGKASKTAGSEDFAYVSHEVPSIMLALAAGQPEKGYAYPQHHPMVRFDEEALTVGAAVYAYMGMKWLEENKE